MRKTIIISALFMAVSSFAQKEDKPFCGNFYNDEYNVYINIDLYEKDIIVPNHEIFGGLPGYLGKLHNSFYWLITSCKVINKNKAELDLINDYGSEDLKAVLSAKNDSVYILEQKDGSSLKVPNKGKWQKMPKELLLKKRKQ